MIRSPRRLIYGASPFLEPGHGELFDADTLTTLAAAAAARTWRELVEGYYGVTYEEYLEQFEVGEVGPADEPADFAAWYSGECLGSPQQKAWDVAHRRVAEILDGDASVFSAVTAGGATPGGHEDSISGPLDQLDALAARVVPGSDGFTLERDDAAIGAAFPATLFT